MANLPRSFLIAFQDCEGIAVGAAVCGDQGPSVGAYGKAESSGTGEVDLPHRRDDAASGQDTGSAWPADRRTRAGRYGVLCGI